MALPRNRQAAANPNIPANPIDGFGRNFATRQFKTPLADQPQINTNQRCIALPQDLIVTGTTGIIANDEPYRSYLFFRNKSALDIFLNFGVEAGDGIGEKISAGGFYEPSVVMTNAIYVWSAGNAPLYFIQGISP